MMISSHAHYSASCFVLTPDGERLSLVRGGVAMVVFSVMDHFRCYWYCLAVTRCIGVWGLTVQSMIRFHFSPYRLFDFPYIRDRNLELDAVVHLFILKNVEVEC